MFLFTTPCGLLSTFLRKEPSRQSSPFCNFLHPHVISFLQIFSSAQSCQAYSIYFLSFGKLFSPMFSEFQVFYMLRIFDGKYAENRDKYCVTKHWTTGRPAHNKLLVLRTYCVFRSSAIEPVFSTGTLSMHFTVF